MEQNVSLPRLYAILDVEICGGEEKSLILAKEAIDAGIRMVQVRWKSPATDRQYLHLCQRVVDIAQDKALVIVNDRPDIARISGANGVHLGKHDLPVEAVRESFGENIIIGYSCHSIPEVSEKSRGGTCNYLAFGTVFRTTSKKDPTVPQGIEKLRRAVEHSNLPLYAIGGIHEGNAHEVMKTGAYGIACISAIFKSRDVGVAVKALRSIVEEGET